MSTIWTPGGERPVGRPEPEGPAPLADDPHGEPTEEELQAHLAELRDQLAQTPVEHIIGQLASQLFEVAALHLSLQPPNLAQASLAIDAMGALVEGLGDRLGPDARPLTEGLTQLRLAFVQIRAAFEAGTPGEPSTNEPPAG